MLLKRIKTRIVGEARAEDLSDTTLLCLMSDEKTLEERVTEAFELLRTPLYRYLVASFGNQAEAEDLTQETFARLYDSLLRGNAIRNIRFWAFRVAHNLVLERHRKTQFIRPLDADSWEEMAALLPDAGLNPEQDILRREKFARLHESFKRLSANERHALYLRSRGFKYKEIAEIMDIHTSTVAESLRRGIKKLSEHQGD